MNNKMTTFSTTTGSLDISCPHFKACPGCVLQKQVDFPPVLLELQDFFSSLEEPFNLKVSEITKWRTRVKLAVRGNIKNPQIGLFKRGTHQVVPIPSCSIHHPKINPAIAFLRHCMMQCQIAPYDDLTCRGLLRYCQMVVERKSEKIQLTLVINASDIAPNFNNMLEMLIRSGLFQSIWINRQPLATNIIFGEKWSLWAGEPLLQEQLDGLDFFFHPACFSQAHLSLFEKLLQSIKANIIPQKKVVEYYAGIGVIGLSVLERSRQVVCSEINPFAKACFETSQQMLIPENASKVQFALGPADSLIHLLDAAEVVIIDPPRKGCDPKLLDAIIANPTLEQIIYVSCGPRSFMQDCAKLINNGWRFQKAEGYLLFPGTDHVEILGILTRSRPAS